MIAASGRGLVWTKGNDQDHFVSSEEWAKKLEATSDEAKIFSTLSGTQMWDYAVGLMNKAGFMRFQQWIARDVKGFLQSFGLKDEAYDAIHVRRGDKLIKEVLVEPSWSSRCSS